MERGRGERLCCWSSVLPWSVVADDGVEDGEEFSGCCDEGDHLGLSGGDEAVAEGFEGWVVTGGGHGGEEEDGAHGGAASADEAPAAPPPRLPGEGGKAGERRDLAPLEAVELGQLGQEGAGDDRPDAGRGDPLSRATAAIRAPDRRSPGRARQARPRGSSSRGRCFLPRACGRRDARAGLRPPSSRRSGGVWRRDRQAAASPRPAAAGPRAVSRGRTWR